MKHLQAVCIGVLILFFSSCDFPRDPRDSFKHPKDDKLLIGIAENSPLTVVENENFSGTEIDLIQKFAELEGLEIKFEKDSESDLSKNWKNMNYI